MVGAPIEETEGQYISALRRDGFRLQEIADMTGRHVTTICRYLRNERKQLWVMKTEEYWQLVEENKDRLNKIIGLALNAVEDSDGDEPAKIAAAVNAIEAQNKLLALPDFVKEQRAKDRGDDKLMIIVDNDGVFTRKVRTDEELDGDDKAA